MAMGELFSLSYYKDIPWVLAAGGSKGEVAVWDTEESEALSKHFTPFLDNNKVTELGGTIDKDEDIEENEDEEADSDEEESKKSKKKSKKD